MYFCSGKPMHFYPGVDKIANANVTKVPADLLVLKYAGGLHGADQVVAKAIGFDATLKAGTARFCQGDGIAATEVVFIGVGPLSRFRYKRIHEFGSQAVRLARKHSNPIRHLAITVHGPGYGLSLRKAFISMISGIVTEWKRASGDLQTVTVVEIADKRCEQLYCTLRNQFPKSVWRGIHVAP